MTSENNPLHPAHDTNGPTYMVFSIEGYRHLIIGYGDTIHEAQALIAEDFDVAIEDVEYEDTLTSFESYDD